ncbi:MAG TPA: hypothetical protein VNA04_05415 [Thermoanaerobaculia bacterium]|nr:hypothetical protein [Thermoanaerobaculia bacterium]
MAEERFCTNCRAPIPWRADTCPACGVYAGEVFDGRLPRQPRRWKGLLIFLLVAGLAVAGGWLFLQRRADRARPSEPPPVSVVSDRPGGTRRAPGATINEAEAIRLLRRHLVGTGLANDCIAVSSEGMGEGVYRLAAVNHCAGTRLGRFVVDGKSEEVRRR